MRRAPTHDRDDKWNWLGHADARQDAHTCPHHEDEPPRAGVEACGISTETTIETDRGTLREKPSSEAKIKRLLGIPNLGARGQGWESVCYSRREPLSVVVFELGD